MLIVYSISKIINKYITQHKDINTYPKVLKILAKTNITLKLKIIEANVLGADNVYIATNICQGFSLPTDENVGQSQSRQNSTIQVKHCFPYCTNNIIKHKHTVQDVQPSTSTYHLEGMASLNFQ